MNASQRAEGPVAVVSLDQGAKPRRWRFLRPFLLACLFSAIFGVTYWLTPIRPYATFQGNLLRFSPDGRLLVTSESHASGMTENGPLTVWQTKTGKKLYSVGCTGDSIEGINFSPDSKLLAVSSWNSGTNPSDPEDEETFRLWDTESGKKVAGYGPKDGFLRETRYHFSADGRFLVFNDSEMETDFGRYVSFWSLETRKKVATIEADIRTLQFAPDGKSFVAFRRSEGQFRNLSVWQLDATPVLIKQYSMSSGYHAFSPDFSKLATVDYGTKCDRDIEIWNLRTGETVTIKLSDDPGSATYEFSFVDNQRLFVAHRHLSMDRWSYHAPTTELWDLTSKPKELATWEGKMSVSPNKGWLVIALWNGAKLVNASTLTEAHELVVKSDHGWWEADIGRPFFSPDSSLLATEYLTPSPQESLLTKWIPAQYNPFHSDDQRGCPMMRVWDVATGNHVIALDNCENARFSRDGQVMATSHPYKINDKKQTIKLWRVPFRKPIWEILGWTTAIWASVILVLWLMSVRWQLRRAIAAHVG